MLRIREWGQKNQHMVDWFKKHPDRLDRAEVVFSAMQRDKVIGAESQYRQRNDEMLERAFDLR